MFNPNRHIKALSLIFLPLFIMSCHKELPPCTSDCSDIIFSGTVINGTNNLPVSNTQIHVITSTGVGFPYSNNTIYDVGTVYTDNSGKFLLSKSIDTSVYKSFTVVATAPSNYVTYPQFLNQLIYSTNNIESIFFSTIDSIRQMAFEVFPITKLTINLHRLSPVPTTGYYSVDFTFAFQRNLVFPYSSGSVWCGFDETANNADTTVYLETSPNLYTFIDWSRSDNSVSGGDSILCLPNVANTITVNY